MPRQRINLQNVREIITEWFYTGSTTQEIAECLAREYEIHCTYRTVQKHFTAWGVKRTTCTIDTPGLRLRIAGMFYSGYSDEIIVQALTDEGHQVGRWAVADIRKKIGCHRRMSVEQRDASNQALLHVIKAELDSGSIEGYGKELLQAHFRNKGHNTSRYSMCNLAVVYMLITQ